MRLVMMLILVLSGSVQEPEPRTARERYELLSRQYEAAKKDLAKASEEVHGDVSSDRQKMIQDRSSQVSAFADRFLKLAEEHPDDPIAFDTLVTVVNERFTLDDEVRALGDLVRDHVREKRLAPLCIRLKYLSRSPAWTRAESWLREVIERSPHPNVKASACFNLAGLIEDESQFVRYFQRNPGEADQVFFNSMLGDDGVKKLCGSNPEQLDREAEGLYRRIIEQYPGMEDSTGNLADRARGRLFAIRNLGIGRVAPDIVGEDLDGKPMKLSDFKGKVVVLNFWATWCGPCMALVPRERSLVERLKGRPFALIGVDGDEDKIGAKRVAQQEGMTWRSFWDGGPAQGPIITRWGIHSWPTIYVIDHEGVIRFQAVDFPNKENFEEVVDRLLSRMGEKP
jgi:thiol-disulfide isomerase/thioredoxin